MTDNTIKKILWLEDQFDDFRPYLSALYRSNYIVDSVKSVSEAVEKLKSNTYIAMIFDIKVLPGKSPEWVELDKKKREEEPHFDSYLGLELLESLLAPYKSALKLNPHIEVNPKRIVVFSVVYSKNAEFTSLGIPKEQIINKADATIKTLPDVIKRIENRETR